MQRSKPRLIKAITLLTAIILTTLLVSSCGSSGTAKPSFSQDIQDQLDAALTTRMSEYNVPGAIVGLWVPGQGEWVVSKGKANIETGQAPVLTDKVRIGSVTKTFTATTVLLLAEEGKLSLDDKLSKYEPQVPNAENISVRQLLNMTSGLFNYTDDPVLWEMETADFNRVWTPQELVDIATKNPPNFPPGQQYGYCNTNYILLGMIIEKVTGNKIGDEIQERIIDKLGLTNTSYAYTGEMTGQYMHGYMPSEVANPSSDLMDITTGNPSWGGAAGAMISNLDDMKIWVKALAEGTLLTPEMHQEQVSFAPPNSSSYGLGVMNGGIVIIVFFNRYPSKEEGASDMLLADLAHIVFPLIEK
jgi:D-alanyl-D-alanine carboxypeptidase